MNKIIGIDLGTTNSVVAVAEGGQATVIPDEDGQRLTPSVVAFTDEGRVLVGHSARNQAILNTRRTIYSIKRFMGRRHEEVAEEEKLVSYSIAGGLQALVKVAVNGRLYTPPEISALILKKLKAQAEKHLGFEVKKAIITVPAYFNDSQRQATKDAGRIAGLEVERIINEPTAAALAYGLDKKAVKKIAVFDLGGGTFDISLLELSGEVFQVLATNGDTHLGGDDFDKRIVNWVYEEFQKANGVALPPDPAVFERIRQTAEKVKCDLSDREAVDFNLPAIYTTGGKTYHFFQTLTREKMESLIREVAERVINPCRRALDDASTTPEDLDEIILVGGSTRMPLVRTLVRELFKREPNTSVNPDEVVAMGAAIQGAVLAGDVTDVLLLDVNPLSLGIETYGGAMSKLIFRNSTIPASAKEVFTTAVDNQTVVEIHVLQGERELAKDCRTLGRFTLSGISPQPAGVPRVEVTFTIDVNGILSVSAKDITSGKEESIEVKPSYGLTEEEVNRLVEESVEHALEDMDQRMWIEHTHEAKKIIAATEKALARYGDKLAPEERSKIEQLVTRTRKELESKDWRVLKAAMDELNSNTVHLAEVAVLETAKSEIQSS